MVPAGYLLSAGVFSSGPQVNAGSLLPSPDLEPHCSTPNESAVVSRWQLTPLKKFWSARDLNTAAACGALVPSSSTPTVPRLSASSPVKVFPAAVSGFGMFGPLLALALADGVADADGLFSPASAALNSSSVGLPE